MTAENTVRPALGAATTPWGALPPMAASITATAGGNSSVYRRRIFIGSRGSAAVAAAVPTLAPRRIRLERGPLNLEGKEALLLTAAAGAARRHQDR